MHYNSFGTISVKNSLDTDAVGIYQGHEEEEHFSWHKYRSRVYIDLQMKKSVAQISKEKIHLWQRKNTIFKLSFPKLAGSIPWDGNVHICCERKCQTKKTPVLQKKKKNKFYWN